MYIPQTAAEQQAMLDRIGAADVESLFSGIPESLRLRRPLDLPPALTEQELTQHLGALAKKNASAATHACFLGGGCYDHFIPAVVDAVAGRSEYYTAYTPYQAEASQGTLQVGFEFQTLLCQLTGMEAANASLYEGATAVVEAVLMARASTNRLHGKVVVSEGVHPEYRQTLATYLVNLGTELVVVPVGPDGATDAVALSAAVDEKTAAVVVQSPNFFGVVETKAADAAALARSKGAVAVQAFDPISLGLLKSPGANGFDVAVGEGQSLGTPMGFGGPFLGLFACRESFVRRMPGRVVGQTVDRRGERCFVLTLQTREQHIRREKATSNICSNQGLIALRASVYLSLLGPRGLRETAELCWRKARYAAEKLAAVPGIKLKYAGPFFKEFVLELPDRADAYLPALLEKGFHAGVPLGRWNPAQANQLLTAVTEKRSREEIDALAAAWKSVLAS
ncbi:MAG: aminomethyl-transferring glycine dehydrogenase subunit GcvPA [Planctomycetia bacterium]